MATSSVLPFLIACQTAAAVTEPPPAPPGVPPPRNPPTAVSDRDLAIVFHMHRNLDLLRAIERLLVRGNLTDARALARSMAEAPEPLALEPWARQLTVVRDRAAALAAATAVDEACRLVAKLSEACANCHADTGAIPVFDNPPATPDDQPTISARMARHRWAADRLWEGMVGDADQPWRAGLDVLAQTPVSFSNLGSDRVALAKRLQGLAIQARQQQAGDTRTDRARSYGEILVVCAACHSGKSTTSPKAEQ